MTLISELKEQCGATPKAPELSPAWASLERRTWTIPGSQAKGPATASPCRSLMPR